MITAIKPTVNLDARYTSTATAKHLGIHLNTLARWVKEGKIAFRLRADGKTKFYTGAEIIKCWKNEY